MKEHFRALRQVLQLWSEDKLGESAPRPAHFQQRVAEAARPSATAAASACWR